MKTNIALTQLKSAMDSYAKTVARKNRKLLCGETVPAIVELSIAQLAETMENIVDNIPKLKARVNDILSNTVVKYGVNNFSVRRAANLFDGHSEIYSALYYEFNGFDFLSYLESLGRPVVMYRGYPFDRNEICDRVKLPWHLVEELDTEDLRTFIINHYLIGVMGNPALATTLGKTGFQSTTTKKHEDAFNAIIASRDKTIKKQAASAKEKETVANRSGNLTAAQARTTKRWQGTNQII